LTDSPARETKMYSPCVTENSVLFDGYFSVSTNLDLISPICSLNYFRWVAYPRDDPQPFIASTHIQRFGQISCKFAIYCLGQASASGMQ